MYALNNFIIFQLTVLFNFLQFISNFTSRAGRMALTYSESLVLVGVVQMSTFLCEKFQRLSLVVHYSLLMKIKMLLCSPVLHCWQSTLFKGCLSEILKIGKRVGLEIFHKKGWICEKSRDKIKKGRGSFSRGDCLPFCKSVEGQ